ncbi:MAG: HEPN domain-containing protein [Victivallaceae bacterium]|nr:HEPN domain-containing protein [Victivallaceae bacterium]
MINLSGLLAYLPENKIRELETVTRRIAAAGEAELIILYGSYARGNYRERRGKITGTKSDYDLLAISSDVDRRDRLRSKLRDGFADIAAPVQVIVEDINFVNRSLEENQFFFTDIKREGKILYDSGNCRLADFKGLTPVRRREIAEEDFKEWKKQVDISYKYSKIATAENDLRKAAFELQQTAELCYKTVEMVFTHYNPYEHHLGILRKRALKFDRRLKAAFPQETGAQQDLFDQLDSAYIGARYRSEEEFPVSRDQLVYWSGEAGKLLDLTEMICKEKIENLSRIEREPKA